jgi:hypothetical protein|tara:strand:- start:261 stop:476 length:216 start_codon:yes stop_codon:yes gene_type:complete
MNDLNDPELDYQGVTENALKTEQLDAAVRALHVLAIMQKGDSAWMASYAIDALREIEALGYQYETFRDQLN